MPTYEYRCTACGKQHDIFQKMSDPPATECPSCGKPGLERLISAAAFALKGSGWYADGYGGGDAKKPDAPKTEAAKPDAKADAPKVDAPKVEAPKSEPKPEAPKKAD